MSFGHVVSLPRSPYLQGGPESSVSKQALATILVTTMRPHRKYRTIPDATKLHFAGFSLQDIMWVADAGPVTREERINISDIDSACLLLVLEVPRELITKDN